MIVCELVFFLCIWEKYNSQLSASRPADNIIRCGTVKSFLGIQCIFLWFLTKNICFYLFWEFDQYLYLIEPYVVLCVPSCVIFALCGVCFLFFGGGPNGCIKTHSSWCWHCGEGKPGLKGKCWEPQKQLCAIHRLLRYIKQEAKTWSVLFNITYILKKTLSATQAGREPIPPTTKITPPFSFSGYFYIVFKGGADA